MITIEAISNKLYVVELLETKTSKEVWRRQPVEVCHRLFRGDYKSLQLFCLKNNLEKELEEFLHPYDE